MNRRILSQGAGCVVLLAVGVWWSVWAAEVVKPPVKVADPAALGGGDRFLTHVSTDKPVYKPGEELFVRGVVLHHSHHTPLPAGTQVQATVEIAGPKGDIVASGHQATDNSVLGFQWTIPPEQAGGEYTVKVSYPWQGYTPAQRKFEIRAYQPPRLRSQIKFLRDGYGPGDDVVATLHTERAEGGIPAGATVTVSARVDGVETYAGRATVDAKGDCLARFPLPSDIRRGEGTLVMSIEDGGVIENASKTIPILLQTVDLTLYPEGGELVAGFENRVYFEAFTPAKKPADLAGIVVDEQGREVAKFRSEHEGRGRFAFTPAAEGKYVLKITEPSGIKTQYPLPTVLAGGAIVRATRDTYERGQPIELSVATSVPAIVTLSKQEFEISQTKIEAGTHVVKLTPPGTAEGVLVATVWSPEGRPLAERLIFRQPAKAVQVKVTADAKQYVPAGKVRLSVATTDEQGRPLKAVVGLTATDDSVLEMIEKREQPPRLPVMVLLENDVRELADAHVYLDPNNPKAPQAVDLLLGTQGWRRFATHEGTLEKFLEQHGDAARRALAVRVVLQQELFERAAAEAKSEAAPFRGAVRRLGVPGGPVPLAEAAVPVDALADRAKPQAAVPVPAAPAAPVPDVKSKENGRELRAKKEVEQLAREPVGRANAAQDARFRQAAGQAAAKPDAAGAAAPGFGPPPAAQSVVAEAANKAFAKRRQDALLRDEAVAIRNDFVAVRVYAHTARSGRQPADRVDFRETLFWHAGLQTDDNGQGTVEFALNDSVTTFRVFAEAFDGRGGLGDTVTAIESVQPFYLEPKLPTEVRAGDYVRIPIGIVNATDVALDSQIQVDAHILQKSGTHTFAAPLAPGARVRKMVGVLVGKRDGEAQFTLDAAAGAYRDRVTRSVRVKPLGFPAQLTKGGLIGPGETVTFDVRLPQDVVPGSLRARAVVYPTPLASMNEALASLIREPYGCFEQTSSTTYPLVMAQQYFLSHQGVDPSLIERSSQILETGYQRLRGFECKSGGFEWFGQDPGHDALTAYGLLEFTDMAKVRSVDAALLDRTRTWLLAQRDGKGGFARKTHTYHVWLAEPEIANTYNLWALFEAGVTRDLEREVAWVRDAASRTDNTYVQALAANVLSLAADKDGENQLLDKLAGLQTESGSLRGATRSVVGSTGEALDIETTALAVMAWLRNPSYTDQVEKSIKFLAESCKGGRFGSTQSTVLALRAVVAYDKSRAKPKAPGQLVLTVNGQPFGTAAPFTPETQGAIELPDSASALGPGEHKLSVQMTGGSPMPYSMAIEYYRLQPVTSDKCALHLETTLLNPRIEEGKATDVSVVVVNRTGEKVPNPMAIIGIPGGLKVRHDQLKELVKQQKIAAYEVLGQEVVLYWRALDAEQRVELPLSLIAEVPGTYTAPASRAYLYYTDEHKHWVEGFRAEISPKGE